MRFFSLARVFIAVLAVSSSVAVTASAETQPPPPPPGTPMGLEVMSADPGARTVQAKYRCVQDLSKVGQSATFKVAAQVDMNIFGVGKYVGALVDTNTEPDTIVAAKEFDCRQPPPGGDQPPPPPPGDGDGMGGDFPGGDEFDQDQEQGFPGGDEFGEGDGPGGYEGDGGPRDQGGEQERPSFHRGFLKKVWKYLAEVDGYEDGKLSVTISKVLNLPKKFKQQDDELLDQDALVLVGKIRVYDADKKRVDKSELDNAENVRVHGKLLPPAKWQKDEDGEPVATIRSKKIYILD